jgi:predicted GNAT superfamily acetyltransferase
MVLAIRDVQEHDLDAVLAVNNAAGEGILPMSKAQLHHFYDIADYFRVAEADGHLAGFLIALRENAEHDSPNFLWFRERFPRFLYIDRIVIARNNRRHGLGRVFYCDVQSYAEVRVPQLACEVFLEPRDDATLLFHGSFGFHEVGQQRMQGNDRPVSLLSKELCSYGFVREHYLEHGGLPDVSWLHERKPSQEGRAQRSAGNTNA